MKKQWRKKWIPICAVSVMAITGAASGFSYTDAEAAGSKKQDNAKIKNVIFMIGDGMGTSYTSAYRYLKDDPSTPVVEQTAFDPYLVGQQMTYPEDPQQNITDSASAATAMSAGIKT
ncbi:alkaline phosphatase, partial [Domibacillus tundrae]